MVHRLVIVPALAGMLLLPVGCATKTFVLEELQKSETKLGAELSQQESHLGKLETGLTKVASQAEGVSGQVRQVEMQVTGVRSLADEARSRAEQSTRMAGQALARAEETDSRQKRLWANRNKRNLVEPMAVTFGFDKWELDDRAQTALLDVVKQLKETPDLVLDIEGYTDTVGPAPYNVQLSQRRVEAVRRFLVEKGVDLPRIQSIGLGSANSVADNKTSRGRAQNRRVAIKLFAPVE